MGDKVDRRKDPKPLDTPRGARKRTKPNAPFRSPMQLKQDREEMVRLMRRGWSQSQIAEKLGVSAGQVHYDYKLVVKQITERTKEEAEVVVAMKIERLREISREAWVEWERSKCDKERRKEDRYPVKAKEDEGEGKKAPRKGRKKNAPNPDGASVEGRLAGELRKVKETFEVEGRLGDTRYLDIILRCLVEEAKLEGIYPDKTTVVQGQATLSWDQLFGREPGRVNPIEAQILDLVALPGPEEKETDQ